MVRRYETIEPKRGKGQPRLKEGEETKQVGIRLPASLYELAKRIGGDKVGAGIRRALEDWRERNEK